MPRSIKRKSFLPRRKVSEGMPSSVVRDAQFDWSATPQDLLTMVKALEVRLANLESDAAKR